ncbi:MAG: dihydroxy-acid dehydratase [bacterium]
MNLRSEEVLSVPENSMQRSLFKSMGFDDNSLSKPLIGIANSWNTIVPGSYNLRSVAESVKEGIWQAGGTPLEFGTISACDGIAQGHDGMHYILPSREIIANSVEIMVQAHRLDGIVLLGSCDKIVPGMLMAAARVDIPAIMVPGGPMDGGPCFDERKADITALTEGLGMLNAGKIDMEEYLELENTAGPTCGSCSFLGTANTMCALAEAMGMTVPGAGTALATSAKRQRLSRETGRAIVSLIENNITARDIITRESLENAVKTTIAIGGSTNAVLHLLGIAYEADIDFSIDIFDKYSYTIPYLAKIYPSGKEYNVPDFERAGGVQTLLHNLKEYIDSDTLTVTGKTIAENLANYKPVASDLIRTPDNPHEGEGGVAILKGNIAPNTGVSKPSAIDPSMHKFTGKAKVFNSEEEANEAIINNKISSGDVVVIKYEGPKGGPGMREMYKPLKLLYGEGLALETALVTDGRFSGTNNGCFVGHISPEAYEGGPIAIIEDGDKISIDINERDIHLHVSDEVIKERLDKWEPPKPKIDKGYLATYSCLAESANKGAIIKSFNPNIGCSFN